MAQLTSAAAAAEGGGGGQQQGGEGGRRIMKKGGGHRLLSAFAFQRGGGAGAGAGAGEGQAATSSSSTISPEETASHSSDDGSDDNDSGSGSGGMSGSRSNPSTAPSTPTTPPHNGSGGSSPLLPPPATNNNNNNNNSNNNNNNNNNNNKKPIPSLEPASPPLAPPTAGAAPYKTLEPPSPPPPGLLGKLQTFWAICFLGLMGSSFYLVLLVAGYILISLVFLGHRTVPFTLIALWVAQAVAPIKQFEQDPPAMRRSWLFKEMARYFDMRVVIESKLDTSKHYLFAQFPHGTIPLGAVLSAHYIDELVPGKKILCLIHTGIMHLPIVRFFMGHWGALTADKENVAEARRRAGANCSIVVGGVAEIFLQNERTETLRLRKGFIREALRSGFDLVPMFHFGNTRMYKFIGSPSFWRRFSARLPFPFFLVEGWGRVTLIPKKVPILLAVGSPLGAQALCGLKDQQVLEEDPSPEMVDRVYEAFKAQLRTLYYRYRPAWETRDLVIVDA